MTVLPDMTPISTTSFYQQATFTPSPQGQQYLSSPNSGNAFLIAIEVIFSCLVLFVLVFCFFAGIHKRKRAAENRQQMIDNAIIQQERRIQLHLQGQCHSSSTVTALIQCPPPPTYAPPNPRQTLPKDVVSRLDCLLEQNQICTTTMTPTAATTCGTLPKYTELYRNNNDSM